MSFFNAYQLLTEAAHEYHHQRETFSTAEITARINEIKYLSAQKKVPKLSLRKEIVHLERQLSTVMEVEQQMLNQKRHESAKVKSMKKQITELQGRLAAAEDKDVQKKLDRLSQLLGDYLAKKTTEEEVKTAIAELKLVKAEKEKRGMVVPGKSTSLAQNKKLSLLETTTDTAVPVPVEMNEDVQPRITELRQRLEMLKGELELLRILKKDSRAQGVAQKIALWEQKLNEYLKRGELQKEEPSPIEPVIEKSEIKHTLLFAPPSESEQKRSDEELESEKELPLPPPPKMKKS